MRRVGARRRCQRTWWWQLHGQSFKSVVDQHRQCNGEINVAWKRGWWQEQQGPSHERIEKGAGARYGVASSAAPQPPQQVACKGLRSWGGGRPRRAALLTLCQRFHWASPLLAAKRGRHTLARRCRQLANREHNHSQIEEQYC